MIDLPIAELFDDSLCLLWLERHLHPDGLRCPLCKRTVRRLFRHQGYVPVYRCRGGNGYDTIAVHLSEFLLLGRVSTTL